VQRIYAQNINGRMLSSFDPEEDSAFEFALIELGLTGRYKLTRDSKLRDRVGSLGTGGGSPSRPTASGAVFSSPAQAPVEEEGNEAFADDYLVIGDSPGGGSRPSSRAVSASPTGKRPTTVRQVTINKKNPPGGIGLGLVDGADGKCLVSAIAPGGNADQSDLFRIGDSLVVVNGIRVEGMPYSDVISLLKSGDTTEIQIASNDYPYEPPTPPQAAGAAAAEVAAGLARTNSYVIANTAAGAAAGRASADGEHRNGSVSPSRIPMAPGSSARYGARGFRLGLFRLVFEEVCVGCTSVCYRCVVIQ
jgi:hypothetical protein